MNFFPKDAIGSRHKFIKEGKHITIFLEGVDISFKTDIAGEGRNRIRRTGNVFKEFYKFHRIKKHDLIIITRTGKRSYKISPYLNIATSNLKNLKAKPSGQLQPEKRQRASGNYNRNGDVKDYVLNSAKGVCECCMETAPFCKDDGSPFLEIHHVHFLSEGGADTIENSVAVCPNCHKELHFGKKRNELKNKIYKKYKRLKKST